VKAVCACVCMRAAAAAAARVGETVWLSGSRLCVIVSVPRVFPVCVSRLPPVFLNRSRGSFNG
jgi:hypothetical protein